MSLDLLERQEPSQAYSDDEWKPRVASRGQAFDRLARVPASFAAAEWVISLAQDMQLRFNEVPPVRLQSTILQIADLCKLPPNWDSYGARPVDPNRARAAIDFLLKMVDASTPLPSIVPLNQGGVQFEWHCNNADLEIAIASPSRLHVSFEDLSSGEMIEETIVGDLRPIQRYLQRLSQEKQPVRAS